MVWCLTCKGSEVAKALRRNIKKYLTDCFAIPKSDNPLCIRENSIFLILNDKDGRSGANPIAKTSQVLWGMLRRFF